MARLALTGHIFTLLNEQGMVPIQGYAQRLKHIAEEQKAKLAEIDARLDEIEAIEYDECPEEMRKEHDALCKARYEIEPPVIHQMFKVK